MKIFTVIESGGSYEDKWDVARFAFTERPDAEACVAHQLVLQEKRKAETHVLYQFYVQYTAEYKAPTNNQRREIPKWKAGIKQSEITGEMQHERDYIKRINAELDEDYVIRHKAYWARFFTAQCEFATSKGFTLPTRVINQPPYDHEDSTWAVEELELFERFVP
jgi:hypothetical protein